MFSDAHETSLKNSSKSKRPSQRNTDLQFARQIISSKRQGFRQRQSAHDNLFHGNSATSNLSNFSFADVKSVEKGSNVDEEKSSSLIDEEKSSSRSDTSDTSEIRSKKNRAKKWMLRGAVGGAAGLGGIGATIGMLGGRWVSWQEDW